MAFLEKCKNGSFPIGACINIESTLSTHLIANAGFDWVCCAWRNLSSICLTQPHRYCSTWSTLHFRHEKRRPGFMLSQMLHMGRRRRSFASQLQVWSGYSKLRTEPRVDVRC